jgi:hypothetical protein
MFLTIRVQAVAHNRLVIEKRVYRECSQNCPVQNAIALTTTENAISLTASLRDRTIVSHQLRHKPDRITLLKLMIIFN